VVGADLRELVFRAIYSCLNAAYLSEGKRIGKVGPLTPGEIEMAGAINKIPSVPVRTWEYWATRLASRGGMPPSPIARARKRSSSRSGRQATVATRGAGGAKVTRRKSR
jgi:hypothetical protein